MILSIGSKNMAVFYILVCKKSCWRQVFCMSQDAGKLPAEETMAENRYFQETLSSFTSEFAYAGAVRHLYELGYSPQRIQSELLYPVSLEKINRVIEEYERALNNPEAQYEYVQETDELGRRSFRRKYKDKERSDLSR